MTRLKTNRIFTKINFQNVLSVFSILVDDANHAPLFYVNASPIYFSVDDFFRYLLQHQDSLVNLFTS